MKAFRMMIICALTAAVLLAICSPVLLNGILPENLSASVSMDEFPLLDTCSAIIRQLLGAIQSQQHLTVDIVTNALGEHFFDQMISLVMVAMLTIPISMVLGMLFYKPLYQGSLAKIFLYISLNLCSVMLAWILYRQVYFRLLIEGVIQQYITDISLQTIINYATQTISALLVGAVAIKIALAVVAARLMLNKIIMPIIGTFIRTILFAFFVSEILLLQANPGEWMSLGLVMLVTLALSGISDGIFGS